MGLKKVQEASRPHQVAVGHEGCAEGHEGVGYGEEAGKGLCPLPRIF